MPQQKSDSRGLRMNAPGQRRKRFPRGMKSRQLGYGEELFLFFMCGIALLFLGVSGLAVWLGRGVIGKLIGLAIAAGVLSPIWYPAYKYGQEKKQWDSARLEIASTCEREVAHPLYPVEVESVLDDVGGLKSGDLQHLLVDVGLRFVEVMVKPSGNLTENEDYPWLGFAQGKPYAHLQLGDAGSPDCYLPQNRDVKYFFTAASPVKPGTCLQVTYLAAPTAVDEIVEIQGAEPKRFSRWTLRDRYSGLERAGVSDAFRLQQYSQSQPYWDRRNINSCNTGFSGYGMLLDRIRGTGGSIAYNNQFLIATGQIQTGGLPFTPTDPRK